MNVSMMDLKVAPWEYDPDIYSYASAISRQGCGQGRFIDMVVTETIGEIQWEIIPEFVAPRIGRAATREEGMQAAIRAALRLLIHGVSLENEGEEEE